jgi:hypothetical protein
MPVQIIDTESYQDLFIYKKVTERTTLFQNLKSTLFWSGPDLIIKECMAAALAWHGGH